MSHSIPFRGGALAPAGKPQPLFHAGSYLTSNSINAATAPAGKPQPLFHMGSYLTSNSINAAMAPAGKPQPLFHAGSYLTSNSINVAKVVVKRLRLWEPRNRNREKLPKYSFSFLHGLWKLFLANFGLLNPNLSSDLLYHIKFLCYLYAPYSWIFTKVDHPVWQSWWG